MEYIRFKGDKMIAVEVYFGRTLDYSNTIITKQHSERCQLPGLIMPQAHMASITGARLFPFSEILYSICNGF